MATSTFSGRANTEQLQYADALTREQHGMSFGKWCGSLLVEAIYADKKLPNVSDSSRKTRQDAVQRMKQFTANEHNESIGRLDDTQIKDLIASRYDR